MTGINFAKTIIYSTSSMTRFASIPQVDFGPVTYPTFTNFSQPSFAVNHVIVKLSVLSRQEKNRLKVHSIFWSTAKR
jgi:hypothetical protein